MAATKATFKIFGPNKLKTLNLIYKLTVFKNENNMCWLGYLSKENNDSAGKNFVVFVCFVLFYATPEILCHIAK